MPEFRHSVALTEYTPAADETKQVDLGTDPMSHLILRLSCLNNGANTKATLAQILGALEVFEILYKGSAIISVNGADLYALSTLLRRAEPWQINEINTDDAVRTLILTIPFGRKIFDPLECYPETKKGDLVCSMKVDIADTGYDGLILHLEQVELPGAAPKQHLKYTQKVITPAATGEYNVDLPRGNKYAGILFFGTTVPTGTAWTTTLNDFSLLLNNENKFYVKTFWEILHGAMMNRISPAKAWSEAIHRTNTDSTYDQNSDTGANETVDSDLENYALMDFSPNNEDDFLIDSAALNSLAVKPTAGDTSAARCIPIELKPVA
jgi:hypothetical protein